MISREEIVRIAFDRPAVGMAMWIDTLIDASIYREWIVADTLAILLQLGVDHHAYADRIAQGLFAKGHLSLDIGENRRLLGQYPPEAEEKGLEGAVTLQLDIDRDGRVTQANPAFARQTGLTDAVGRRARGPRPVRS